MHYIFNFSWITEYYPIILKGIGVTIELTLIGGIVGIALGIVCAWARALGPKWIKPPVAIYVELIRNTPFIIQLFFIFFGLPATSVKLTEMEAANLAMIINLGAYSCEIIRAGIEATPKGQFEAGKALALRPLQTFRLIILIPALQRIWPALSSQVVIVMLGSAVVSQIAAQDLTFAANFIQSRTFRAFEAYMVSTAVYLLLAILLRQILALIGRRIFPQGATR
ncbi:amino acid ABC transporter permease [Rhizobium oryziradicis]|uniref:Polar amino acid ABC transporter permease n=1 Tax=Rhizobium oryziradicis TaxID=1867956 RepID=A0A1Q8ZMW6_9HYPH|nr:amino acid ABC transporter permease [Rhizobium oryziradicis]OLP43118.1 polar amino acid ABC transporter permease [Rhizobium oryziradicis]